MQITTIGLDIAKNVFQVHGIDAAEKVVVRRQLRRDQVMKFFGSITADTGLVVHQDFRVFAQRSMLRCLHSKKV